MSVRVEHGDCLEVMERLADEGVQVESVVTDPPYHLTSIVKRFGKDGSAPAHDHPEIFQTYQAANRFDIQEDLRLGAQGGNVVVIFDRWHVSSWIYGLTAGMLPSKLEVISEGVLDPDITFILDGQGFDRPETKDDAYEDDSGFQDKVRSRYADHGHSVASVVHVDADRSKKLVHEEIFTMVKRELLKQGML